MEIWKSTFYSDKHLVSNLGRIKNASTGAILKCGLTSKGEYVRVKFGLKTYRVNRVVAIAFIPNPNNLPDVHHLDKNPLNNEVTNLEWSTNANNNKSENKKPRGKFKKLTPAEIQYIKKYQGIKTAKQLAAETGRKEDTISKVWRGVNKNAQVSHTNI